MTTAIQSAEYALFTPPSPYNASRDGRLLIHQLWKLQFGYCAYCGRETRLPRRGADGIDPDEATRDHITPKSLNGPDDPCNLLMSCCECNQEKASMKVGVFMAYKIPKLSVEARQRVAMVEQALLAYFYSLPRPSVKGWMNEYIGLSLARQFEKMAIAAANKHAAAEQLQQHSTAQAARPAKTTKKMSTTQEQPIRTIYVPIGSMPELPAEDMVETIETASTEAIAEELDNTEVPTLGETEIEECQRWTRDIQENLPSSHLGASRHILVILERLVHLNNETAKTATLKNILDAMAGSAALDELAAEVPEAMEKLKTHDNGNFLKESWINDFTPSENIDVVTLQLWAQRILASFNREDRKMAYDLLCWITSEWHCSGALYLSLKSANLIAGYALRLDHAYTNYPKLEKLFS